MKAIHNINQQIDKSADGLHNIVHQNYQNINIFKLLHFQTITSKTITTTATSATNNTTTTTTTTTTIIENSKASILIL